MEAGAEPEHASRAASRAAREAYGRLVALLAYQWRDLAAAQDALGDAFARAVERWPLDGVPESPEAWLLTVARRQLLQAARHRRVQLDPAILAVLQTDEAAPATPSIPDARLRLMFVCAHPAIAAQMHAPLMLQAVLGIEAKVLANVFLVSPSTMAQRLVRAKSKIRDAAIRFEEPERDELPARLDAVLEAIYGGFTIGRQAHLGIASLAGTQPGELTEEALYLGRLVCELMPQEPEALGLAALMLHAHARRHAQFDPAGRFVPLLEQDVSRWDANEIRDAEALLWRAGRLGRPGRFQLEAAIQSAHASRRATGAAPWATISQLYAALNAHWPSTGSRVGGCVALIETGRPADALAALDAMPRSDIASFAPWWAARAHALERLGRLREALDALDRAIGLTDAPALRDHLLGRRLRLAQTPG